MIEGIGPKIESVLNAAGIKTFSDLANTSSSRLVFILANAGPTFRIHDPKTWPQQAFLAKGKDWSGLIKMQKELDGGVEAKDGGSTPSKLEKFIASNN